jgi:hypothetical protein
MHEFTRSERKVLQRLAARGGRARAKSLSPKRRHEIAIKAAVSRWARVKSQQEVLAQ